MQIHSEVATRWLATGFLRNIKLNRLEAAAARLEAVQRGASGSQIIAAVDRELQSLDKEGFFEKHQIKRR